MNHGDSASNSAPADGDARDTRVGKILNEFLDRRARGEPVSEAALLAQHPDLAGELSECLELVRDLQPPADRIDALIAQGVLGKPSDPRYLAELGPYKITDFIGRGGMGVVLKAYEESLDRTVALKILRPELADDRGTLTRFEREAKAAAALNHPNIVTVHAVGQERGSHYIAMEYVAGPSLAEVISCQRSAVSSQPSALSGQPSADVASGLRAGRPDVVAGVSPIDPNRDRDQSRDREGAVSTGGLSTSAAAGAPSLPGVGDGCGLPLGRESSLGPDTIRSIFRQLLSALAAAHEAGLIHRDVKSSNILLDGWERENAGKWERTANAGDDEPSHLPTFPRSHGAAGVPPACVKLADFGLARMVAAETRMTMPHAVLGTPEYMSPEQARGDADIDHRTDLYSAGVVLYEMLTGRTPFKADTPTATIHQILHDEPPHPRKLDKSVDPNLASLALCLMAKRPDDRFASASKALAALDTRKRLRMPRHYRRRLRRTLAAALIGVALLAGGAWLMSRAAFGPRMIAAVRIDPDTQLSIQVRYGDDTRWRRFRDFPTEVSRVAAVQLLNLDGVRRQAIVAGLVTPLGEDNLFAFDARGYRLWALDVSNITPGYEWPDCSSPAHWLCYLVAVGDIDGRAGDEIVVVAKDADSYPTRISIVDPREGRVCSTFWHMGHLEDVRIAPDFFGPTRPALIAWGFNNKLDGFEDPALKGHATLTRYDIVTVVMVLDPADMDGLGPPRTRAVPIDAARPHAYAFLDTASSIPGGSYVPEGQEQRVPPDPSDVGRIDRVLPVPRAGVTDDGPLLKVHVVRMHSVPGAAILTVDRNLNVIGAEATTGAPAATIEDYWRARWRPVIQDGWYAEP